MNNKNRMKGVALEHISTLYEVGKINSIRKDFYQNFNKIYQLARFNMLWNNIWTYHIIMCTY